MALTVLFLFTPSGSDADLDRCNSVASDVFDTNMISDEEESPDTVIPDLEQPRKTLASSSSSDSGCEGDDRRHSNRRRQTSSECSSRW